MPYAEAEAFLDLVCAQIWWKRRRVRVRAELSAHLEDHARYLTERRGWEPDAALSEAVRAMGDPVLLGRAMRYVHRPWKPWAALCLTLLFWCAILYVLIWLIVTLRLL